jgi:hypothetical protein
MHMRLCGGVAERHDSRKSGSSTCGADGFEKTAATHVMFVVHDFLPIELRPLTGRQQPMVGLPRRLRYA